MTEQAKDWSAFRVPKKEGQRPTVKLREGTRSMCPSCWEIFSSEGNFDRHRKGEHDGERFCVQPESVGLSRKANGDWARIGKEKPHHWG